jgi:Concanavalin A-like lectin/glucanases superfamily
LLAAGLLMAVRVPAQTCDPSPSGLISWWPGDGNANDIFSTNNAVLEGGATDTNVGYIDNCFVFDGTNGFAMIPDAPALHPTNLTIETWIRCDLLDTPSLGSYPGQQYIIFHQNAEEYDFEGFDLAKDRRPIGIATNDTWCFECTSVAGLNTFVESQTFVHTNEWYHIAGVRGSNYIQLYVNGVLEAQTNIDFPVGYGNTPLYFATTGQSYYDHKFAGALDEVGFYNRALSSNEIAAIYAAGRGGKCKTPTVVSIGLSPGAQPPQMIPNLTIGGLAGQTYGIQTTSSLRASSNTWVGLTNLTLPASTGVWSDPAPVAGGQRFYRALPGTISVP